MNQSRYHTLPLEAQYLYRRGLEMVHRQEEQRALTLFRQAVFIAPDFTKAYHEMGSCLARLGRRKEAAASFWKASRNSYKDEHTPMLVHA